MGDGGRPKRSLLQPPGWDLIDSFSFYGARTLPGNRNPGFRISSQADSHPYFNPS